MFIMFITNVHHVFSVFLLPPFVMFVVFLLIFFYVIVFPRLSRVFIKNK